MDFSKITENETLKRVLKNDTESYKMKLDESTNDSIEYTFKVMSESTYEMLEGKVKFTESKTDKNMFDVSFESPVSCGEVSLDKNDAAGVIGEMVLSMRKYGSGEE